ncbi:MAG: 16S rRNA (adenine(1518)-N(6)/adenine(1519)-N(6))-dimethyltransferase [Acidobacteria bacterium]|nr:MAG: 16S rRNA (adenine(1518)-N(6)/adenine(1519)-N(6))-dimethyltransferase [Acidobacteriota bacterium]
MTAEPPQGREPAGGNLEYLNAGAIRALLESEGIRPSKSLGQNFLADANHVRKIAAAAGAAPGVRVVEIGPGLGSLTIGLINAGAEVVAIEKDARFASVLERTARGARVVVADALDSELSSVIEEAVGGDWPAPWRLAANLPYSTGTPIFVKILEEVSEISGGVVMLQREVAERLVARSGDHEYGGVSVVVQYFASARKVGRVPPGVFVPAPRVESVLVGFERREEPPVSADRGRLFELIRAGFSHRRKTFRNSISGLSWAHEALEACTVVGIDPSRRAETMSLEEFGAITGAALEMGVGSPPGGPSGGGR